MIGLADVDWKESLWATERRTREPNFYFLHARMMFSLFFYVPEKTLCDQIKLEIKVTLGHTFGLFHMKPES